jgi:hypothetical protein
MSEMEDDNIDRVPQHRADRRKLSVAELVIDTIKSKQPSIALFPEARGALPDRYAGRVTPTELDAAFGAAMAEVERMQRDVVTMSLLRDGVLVGVMFPQQLPVLIDNPVVSGRSEAILPCVAQILPPGVGRVGVRLPFARVGHDSWLHVRGMPGLPMSMVGLGGNGNVLHPARQSSSE